MADGFGYGGFSGTPPYPFWLSSPSPYPPTSAPAFVTSHPVESYDPTQGGFDPMNSHSSYHRSPPDWSNNPPYRENSRSQTPSSSFYVDNTRPGVCGPRGEDSYKDMFGPSGIYDSRESSSEFVPLPTEIVSERQRLNFVPTYNSTTSTTVSTLADMLIRNSQEPFFKSIVPSGVYASSNALDDPGHYHPGYDKPESMNVFRGSPVEPYICVSVTDSIPPLPTSSFKTQALFDGSQTGIHLGNGRSFTSNTGVCSYAPENFSGVQSSLHGSSIDPVNFDVLLGYGEATGHIKPSSDNPDLHYGIVGSPGSRRSPHPLQFNTMSSGSPFKDKLEGSGVSSFYQRPNTLVADSENGVSESSLKNAIEDFEPTHWSHFVMCSEGPSAPTMFSMGSESCSAMKADIGNAQSAVNYKTPFEGSANQPSEDVQANQKPCKLQEKIFDIMNRDKETTLLTDVGIKGSSRSNADDVSTGRSPARHLCDQGDSPSPTSCPRVSSVINAMHNLSEVLVYECFNNGSWLKLEQLENLDKVVDNLTKCLKKITGSKAIAGDASLPTQAMHVSCPNVVLNEAPKVVAKDFQGFNAKPIDSFGFKESVDKNEMTQRVLRTYLRPTFLMVKKTIHKLSCTRISGSKLKLPYVLQLAWLGFIGSRTRLVISTCTIEEPFLNPQKSVPIMNNVEQEITESLIKHGSNCGNNVVTMSHDAPPQGSRFNSDSVDAVLSLMSKTGGLEQINHGNFKPGAATFRTIQQEFPASITEDKHNDVIDRLQILKDQETNRKLKSRNCPDSDIDVIDRFQILKQQETKRKLKSQSCPETKMGDQEDEPEASEMANIGRSSNVSDIMDRFQILKRREAEQVQKSFNSLNIDSDADDEQPISKTQMHGDLGSFSLMTRLREFHPRIETCVDTEPSASGKGHESLASDWEHVHKDD